MLTPEEIAALPEEARLAIEIADYAALNFLDGLPYSVIIDGTLYFLLGEDRTQELADVLRYCELRNLIRRHPENLNLIQKLEP